MSGPIGFVYILVNEYMPHVYKVGCTERAPHARAEELSRSTGVPAPFDVFVYAECEDFQRVERDMHRWLDAYRISANREFFYYGLELACRLLFWLPGRLAFSEPCSAGGEDALHKLRVDDEMDPSICHWMQTANPWEKKTEETPQEIDSEVELAQASEEEAPL